jgi:hypothetical protein
MPRTRNRPARELWIARLKRHRQSNLTVAEFCRQEGVSAPSFYQWKKKLAGLQFSPQPNALAKFVPLQVTGLATNAVPTLRLPGGAVIELPSTLGREQLTDLIGACIDATTAATGEAPQ